MNLKILGSADIKSKYNDAAYLIDDKILFDMPPGLSKNLRNINRSPSEFNHLIISHYHGDHFLGIPYLLQSKINEEPKVLNIYTDKSGEKKIYDLFTLAFPSTVKKLEKVDLKFIYDNEFKLLDYSIRRVNVKHKDLKNAYGYVFKKDDLVVSFTGDASICEGVEEMASISDYLVADVTKVKGNIKHMGVDNIKDLLNKNKNLTIIASHLSDKARELLEEEKLDRVIIARDYESLNLKRD